MSVHSDIMLVNIVRVKCYSTVGMSIRHSGGNDGERVKRELAGR